MTALLIGDITLSRRVNLLCALLCPNELPEIESDPQKLSLESVERHSTGPILGDSSNPKSEPGIAHAC